MQVSCAEGHALLMDCSAAMRTACCRARRSSYLACPWIAAVAASLDIAAVQRSAVCVTEGENGAQRRLLRLTLPFAPVAGRTHSNNKHSEASSFIFKLAQTRANSKDKRLAPTHK